MAKTDKELKRKLAEWRGFTFEEFDPLDGGDVVVITITPDGVRQFDCPDFPHSLDAIFEHLVPKLLSFLYQYHISLESVRDGWTCQLFGHTDNPYIPKRIDETAETPALALCKAIENLIDAEKRMAEVKGVKWQWQQGS